MEEAVRFPVIILAGGKSTRLGRDKASEILAGRSLLQRAIDACEAIAARYAVVTAKNQQIPKVETDAPVTLVEDAYPDTGPLGAIYTGLVATNAGGPLRRGEASHALVVACDMPLLQLRLLRALAGLATGHDAVVPLRDGLPEPLCGVYSAACTEPARHLLERGAHKVSGMLDAVDTLLVPETQWRAFDAEGISFLNVNREEDLERARALIRGRRT